MQPAVASTRDLLGPPPGNPLAGTWGFLWTLRVSVYFLLCIGAFTCGPVIGIAALAAAMIVPFSDRAGLLRCVLRFLGAAVGVLLIPAIGLPIGAFLAGWLRFPSPVALAIGVVGLVITCGFIGSQLGRIITRRFRRRRYLFVINRSGGMFFGLGEGALLAAIICWAGLLFGPTIALYAAVSADRRPSIARLLNKINAVRLAVREDPLGRALDDTNPLPLIPEVATIQIAGELWAEPWLFWDAVKEGELDELLAVPCVRRHYERIKADPDMRRAVKEHDLDAVLRSRHYAIALADDEFCQVMAEHWPRFRRRITAGELRRAKQMALERLDGFAQARLERAVKKAREYGIEVP